MDTPARIFRADAEEFDTDPPPLSKRRQAQRDRIFRIIPALIARRGLEGLTLPKLALALDISTSSLRRHIVDLDYFLYKVLRAHLQTILAALAEIAPGTPDRAHRLQAAYRALTHTESGAPIPAHLLLGRHRDALPEDLRAQIDELCDRLRALLAAATAAAEPQPAQPPHAAPPSAPAATVTTPQAPPRYAGPGAAGGAKLGTALGTTLPSPQNPAARAA